MKVGDHVIVAPNHVFRGGECGTVVDSGLEGLEVFNPPVGRWCVKFDSPGTGIKGLYLFLGETELTLLEN